MKKLARFLLQFLFLFMVAPFAAASPVVEAYLYNPVTDQITINYPYHRPADVSALKASLNLLGSGFVDGEGQLTYSIEEMGKSLFSGSMAVKIKDGHFNVQPELPSKFPQSDVVAWHYDVNGVERAHGTSALKWSRFHGKVAYKSGTIRSTYIALIPLRWGDPGSLDIPVAEDGSFDALVPARVYAVVNVNGGGYLFDAMERWAGTYDLTQDREDHFDIGRMEIYGLRAFDMVGGANTLYLLFRPSSLTRVMHFDADGDGVLSDTERKAMVEASKNSATVLGPELKAEDVKVWFDGAPLTVAQMNQISEYDGNGYWQVNYLLQCPLDSSLKVPNLWHHIKIEAESRETLRGNSITDFGQSSVDILWQR